MTHREIYTDDSNSRSRITIGANETTMWFPVSSSGGNVAVRPTAGTIRVELTGSPLSIVLDDNANGTSGAIAAPWVHGNVLTEMNLDYTHTTAIRFVSIGAGGGGDADISE